MDGFPRQDLFLRTAYMFRGSIVCVVYLATLAIAEDPLHVYYYNGEAIEQMGIKGVTVTVSLKDTGKLNQVAVYVDNSSSDAVNVIPSNFSLHQIAPKDEDLAMKPEQEVQRISGHHALWGQVASGVGTGLSRAKDKMAGKEDDPGKPVPQDFEAQARWLAHVDELGEKGQIGALGKSYLRGSTVFPGTKFAGVLWFDRDDAFSSGMVRVVFGARTYLFPFPPPPSATTPADPNKPETAPQNPPEKPAPAKSTSSHTALRETSPSKAGVLGISGENWADGGMQGVRITEVSTGSSAELAGLRGGFVITELDARRIASTDDLAAALAQRGPGTRVHVTYLIRTNLGWMPKETTVILGRGD